MQIMNTLDVRIYSSLVGVLKGNRLFKLEDRKAVDREFFKIPPAAEPLLYRATSSMVEKTASAREGIRKAILNEAFSSLLGAEGLSFYIIEAGSPKLFYPVGKNSLFFVEIPENGFYAYGSKVLIFDTPLSSATLYKISEETERDILFLPVKREGECLGIIVAQSRPGSSLAFNYEKFGCARTCPLPESRIPLLVKYFEDVGKFYTMAMGNWFDATTSLLNRHCFETEIYPSMLRWLEKGMDFTILFMDLDRFKAVNDTYGHGAGDAVLKSVGETLVKSTKSTSVLSSLTSSYPDFFVRWGGDEFVGILQNTNCETAIKPVRRLQERISEIGYGDLKISASFGMLDSQYMRKKMGEGEFRVMENIDTLLYNAKMTRCAISYVSMDGALTCVT